MPQVDLVLVLLEQAPLPPPDLAKAAHRADVLVLSRTRELACRQKPPGQVVKPEGQLVWLHVTLGGAVLLVLPAARGIAAKPAPQYCQQSMD